MSKIKKGNVVSRISYGNDIIFRVQKIVKLHNGRKIALLKGVTERITADSDLDDLQVLEEQIVKQELNRFDAKLENIINKKCKKTKEETNKRKTKESTSGKILHLDGDKKYSEKSLKYYQSLGLNAIVKNIPENKQPYVVYNLLEYYKPDILVITGHDRNDKKWKGL